MKKNLIYAAFISAILVALPASLTALEFGGSVTNNSKLKTNSEAKFKFDQTDSASLWIKAPIVKTKDMNSYFAAQGTYSFERDFNTASNNQYFDLDLCKFVYSKAFSFGSLELSAGRFATYDLSGFIFSQKADGFDFSFKNADVEVDLYGSYTGLLNAKVDTMLDYKLSKLSGDDKKLYDFAGKNLVGIAYVKFPSLFLQQNLAFQGMGTVSLESEKYNRTYVSANLSGPLAAIVYYNVCSTLGITKYDSEKSELGNLTSASVTVFPPVLNSSITWNAIYASGNQGSLKPFRSITSINFCDALNQPEYSGMAKTGIAFTIKPVQAVLLSGSFDLIFNTASGEKENQIKYKGIQFSAGADYQVVSDFMIGAKYNIYSDKENSSINKQQIAVNACLKF